MEDQRLARDEERRLQQEVAQVEENVASGGSQSTVSTMQTKQKKALPASKPVRTTAVKSKAGRPKVTKSATAVVEHEQPPMAYVAEVTTRCEDGPTLQLTDVEIQAAQARSRLVRSMVEEGSRRGMKVLVEYNLAMVQTPNCKRVILPPELWATAFKVAHDSVWAGHLRAPHTYARLAQQYWWPRLQQEVRRWVLGCQECGSRKARSREVVPPLRSLRGGDVGDRWALDVAGPLPVGDGGQRYVIAAVEYVTRYAVAVAVPQHTAEDVATFLMKHVVLKFGPFRELLTDGAPELTGHAIEQLVVMLQSEQINPVPYRPQMIGLVERFHRTWKDCVATYMNTEGQHDWDKWVDFAVYAYNSGRHSTVGLSPNELMMGRRLREPNELLRAASVTEAGALTAHYRRLLVALQHAHTCAERARELEQQRQARYYNRRVRKRREFHAGDRVWMYRPPRGPKASKFVHAWLGPLQIVEEVGYENYLLEREDTVGVKEQFITHVSFLVSYHYPVDLLKEAAADIGEQLAHESAVEQQVDVAETGAPARAASAAVQQATAGASSKRSRRAVGSTTTGPDARGRLVERRRRKRRNKAGQYVLEFELHPAGDSKAATRRWVSFAEYEQLCLDDRLVEESGCEEGV
ncbi:hypothetical protein PR003_g5876 [Phytophthora rubi]|uniref:Integrase catalytic domain-containing protein n=1 Tax=Phytophthora rubi TaxID=129364 RepID=A0A6A3KS71_9STRA|nr:hypothetical protein PR001_g17240 [Phytophthora rubi]KAE9349464.1 hypothetical protein PR003_g5876 [Phytophthora rubi]